LDSAGEGGSAASYEQKSFPEQEKRGKFRLIASRDASDGFGEN